MNKLQRLLVILFITICIFSIKEHTIYSINLDFKYIIDTVGIPEYNKFGDRINEEIYFSYNVFVYSNPIEILKRTNIQRFKEVQDKGKYRYGEKRGEFYILGTNYDGDFVYNVYFPVDFVPETLPENWEYLYFRTFEESWNSNYKYEEQLEYMKNTNLLFDRIDLVNKICDSYEFVEYNISPNKIGLGMFRLNTSATWKTMGIVTAKRKAQNGTIREVVFATKPMSADADVKSKLNVIDEVYLSEDEDKKEISIVFGAEAVKLSKYAKDYHIKKINSDIYINSEYVDSISGSKITNVDKKINFVISREKDNFSQKEYSLRIEVISYLYTEFSVDGLMYNHAIKEIPIKIAPKKLVPVRFIELNLLSKYNNSWVVSPLVQTINTNEAMSQGIIEKGKNLAVKIEFDIDLSKILNLNIYINDKEYEYNVLKKTNEYIIIKVSIQDLSYISIASWKTLRDLNGDYFNINFEDIGKRVKDPNKLDIKLILNVNDIEYLYTTFFDVTDEYLYNINYKYYDSIVNFGELEQKNEI